ncbi:hypothetical protein Q8G46_27670, partial [Klebsiella pneumoniae]|uniref:hypothetical protein n=1 Tax=Klebsiella pneumoniae TaxID=573 RepID=UPI0030138C5B
EDQFITPWSVSVASGYSLLRNPHHNNGLAFTDKREGCSLPTGSSSPIFCQSRAPGQESDALYTQLSSAFAIYIWP